MYADGSNAEAGHLVWASADGAINTLPFGRRVWGSFSLSPNGRQLGIKVTTPAGGDELWFLDLVRGTRRVWGGGLTPGGAGTWDRESRYVYQTFEDDRVRLFRIDPARAEGGELLYAGDEILWVLDVAPDGRLLVGNLGPRTIMLVTVEELAAFGDERKAGLPEPIIGAGPSWFATFSPDSTTGGWLFHRFRVADVLPPTNDMVLRFVASDFPSGSEIEAAIDDLVLVDCAACPLGLPAEVANLRLTRSGSAAGLEWDAVADASNYAIYRGTQRDTSDLACFDAVIPTSSPDDGMLPAPGDVFFYVVTARNCGGESILGPGRTPVSPCP